MDDNPYRSPLSDESAEGDLSSRPEDLRRVALYQRCIQGCLLAYLGAAVGLFLVPVQLRLVFVIAVFVVGLTAALFSLLLATKVYGTVLGILLGFLTFIPCVTVIVLVIVDGKASYVLRKNGYKVGLFGAKLGVIPRRTQ